MSGLYMTFLKSPFSSFPSEVNHVYLSWFNSFLIFLSLSALQPFVWNFHDKRHKTAQLKSRTECLLGPSNSFIFLLLFTLQQVQFPAIAICNMNVMRVGKIP